MSDLLNRIDLRFDYVENKLKQHVIDSNGCWNFTGNTAKQNGYCYFLLHCDQSSVKRRTFAAHRVSFAFHHGIDPAELLVCHRCDNPKCINPDHLFLGTAKDNAADMVAKNRSASQIGEKNSRCKVTREIVEKVVHAISEGKSNTQISAHLPITHAQVSMIRLGKSWRETTKEMGYDPDSGRIFTRSDAQNAA